MLLSLFSWVDSSCTTPTLPCCHLSLIGLPTLSATLLLLISMEMDSAMDLDSNLDEAADYTSMSCPELNLCTQSQKRKAAVVDDSDESEDLCSDGPRVLRATRVSCSSHEKDDMELSTLNDTDSEGYYCTLVKRMPRKLMSIKPTLEQLPKEVSSASSYCC